jgi:hypothetical protein
VIKTEADRWRDECAYSKVKPQTTELPGALRSNHSSPFPLYHHPSTVGSSFCIYWPLLFRAAYLLTRTVGIAALCTYHRITNRGVSKSVTRLRAERPGFDSRQGYGFFLFATASRSSLRTIQLPKKWLPGAFLPGVKRPEREADHFHLVPRLRMSGGITPHLTSSWGDALISTEATLPLPYICLILWLFYYAISTAQVTI